MNRQPSLERSRRIAADRVLGLDGIVRDKTEEREISLAFARLFANPDGAAVLAHLRAITVLNIAGPDASDSYLRHLEGQRFLTALIERRIAHGRNPESSTQQ